MSNTTAAKKALRQSSRRRAYNIRRKHAIAGVTKQFRILVASGKHAEATALLPRVYKAIDKATKTNVLKRNTASRKKSRLAKLAAVQKL